MAKISLVVVDNDTFFTQSFSRYVLEHNTTYDITTFTQADIFVQSAGKVKTDILLIEKDMFTDEIKACLGNYVVLMLDDISKDGDPYSSINKYQKAESIMKEITFRFAESRGDKSLLSTGSGAKVISVYSPVGGAGKTTLSLAVAGALAKNGYGTMYFSLEKFNSASCVLKDNGMGSISEIFLKLKNGFGNLSFEIMKRLQTDESGVKYLAPPESSMEYNEISTEEFMELIKEIAATSGIDYLIIDLPTEYNEDIINYFKISDAVVFITTEDAYGLAKTAGFLKEVYLFPDLRIVYDKIIPIVNKAESRNPSSAVQQVFGEKNIAAAVPYMSLSGAQSVSKVSSAVDSYISELIRLAVNK